MDNLPRTPEAYRRWWAANTNVPYGECWCGCGQTTPRAKVNRYKRSVIAGEPSRYAARGHWSRSLGPDYRKEDRGYDTLCWVWLKGLDGGGYAQTCHEAKTRKAVRIYYQRIRGPIPQGLELDHLCRVRACVNPGHVEPVTRAVNTRRGNLAKLDMQKAEEIRRLMREGATQHELACRFGVHQTTVRDVWIGKSWS